MAGQSDNEIGIGAYRFDPAEGEPDLPEHLRLGEDDTGYARAAVAPAGAARPTPYLVQFERRLAAGDQMWLRDQHGLRLTEHVAPATYLERLEPDTLAALRAESVVRAVVPYHPAFRLQPSIGDQPVAASELAPQRTAGWRFLVVGFPEASAEELQAEVEQLGLEVTAANEEGPERTPRLVVDAGGSEDAERLARIPDVRWVEEAAPAQLNDATTSWVIQTDVVDDRAVWAHGLRGDLEVIGHIDTVLDIAHCFFRDATNNAPRPDHRKVVALRNVVGGAAAMHGTLTAGIAAGEDVGADAFSATPNANNGNAPRAKLSHSNLADVDAMGGASSFRNLMFLAHADGARIHSNSWDQHALTGYGQLSADLDGFTWDQEDDLVIIGPDNAGPIHPPDTSKNALVVNSTRQSPNERDFSSGITQFTPDGRRKPDLTAPGEGIHSADFGTPCGIRVESGTSAAAPAVAGAAAMVRQYYLLGFYPGGAAEPAHTLTPTAALVKATLINATVPMNTPDYPGAAATGTGWGRLLLVRTLFFSGGSATRKLKVFDVRHDHGLEAGSEANHRIKVEDSTEQLKITLVWTEPPGASGSATPVVNDLNLSVRSPSGNLFLGNHLSGGVSVTGGAADALNNVEMVVLDSPEHGTWNVRVSARTVAVGKSHHTTLQPCQGYAVVASGGIRSGPCFVAGAVYADPLHPDVTLLRAWRDRHLESGARGRRSMDVLAALYDRVGPPLAAFVEPRRRLARVLRVLALRPLVALIRRRAGG